jgi:hypothetical protein
MEFIELMKKYSKNFNLFGITVRFITSALICSSSLKVWNVLLSVRFKNSFLNIILMLICLNHLNCSRKDHHVLQEDQDLPL